jgi:DNA primase catalytic core
MARVPEAELERIKREVSIVRLVEARGVKLSGSGDNLMGLCPLPGHDDRSPSLVVSPSKNIWHCLGACQTGGSVIDWVMRAEGVSFRLAVEMLRKRSPSLAADQAQPGTRPKLDVLAKAREPDAAVLRRVVDLYHATAKESPEVKAYLESRGLTHPELIDTFHLGYANRTLGYRLPSRVVAEGAALRAQLTRLGIMRESGHEHLTGSLVVPVFGEDGEVLELYGRKITEALRKGTPKHLYLPSRPDGRRGVFNLAGIRSSKEIIVCEALIDALTFWCAGLRNVTSAYGVEGFTSELRSAVARPGVERVLIAYDRDEAGDQAAGKLAESLSTSGVTVYRVLFPKGMDVNEYALKVTPASRSLETALRGAQWVCGTRAVSTMGLSTLAKPVGAGDPEPELEAEPAAPAMLEVVAKPMPEVSESKVAPSHEPSPPAATLESARTPPASENKPKAELSPASIEGPSLDLEVRAEEICVRLGSRRWRVRGLSKNSSYESLRVTLHVSEGALFFVDTLELYSARHRAAYLKQASEELGVAEKVLKSDLGRIVLRLEELVHAQIDDTLTVEPREEMSDGDRQEALELLRDPQLLDRVLEDFEKSGVVGEETNKLIGYLAAVSRKLEAPLAVVIQSSSAAGKSSLMDAVLRFMPPEERVQYSAMTGQSLFYMGETNLSHKILAIAEEEGAQSASYALKLLQSEGELTIASTGKDPSTGRLVTQEYRVEGPVMIFLTTTAIEVDEELLNRCVVLTVDEGAAQTTAIHARQRSSQTLEGLLARHDRDQVVRRHQNAQRLLEPLLVANPWANELQFASHSTRTRRDHMKYLTLIRAVALLHQHQRPVRTVEHRGQSVQYIEVTKEDIAVADRLCSVALGDGLDELPAQTRRLLEIVTSWVVERAKAEGIEPKLVRFTRRELRQLTRWSHTAIRKHLSRLEDLEHVVAHGGGGRRQVAYELAGLEYDGRHGSISGDLAPPWHAFDTPGGAKAIAYKNRQKTRPSTPEPGAHLESGANGASASESYSYPKANGAAG